MFPALLRVLRTHPRLALVASFIFYALCLLNDGYYIDRADPDAWAPAWGLLLCGWIGVLSGTVAWLANPALFFSWFLFLRKEYSGSLLTAMTALLLMISFLFQTTVISSEAPTYSRITGYGTGFWLWIISSAIQAIGCAVMLRPRAP